MPDFTSNRPQDWDGFDIDAKFLAAQDVLADKVLHPSFPPRKIYEEIAQQKINNLSLDESVISKLPLPTTEEVEQFDDASERLEALMRCRRKLWQRLHCATSYEDRAAYAVMGISFQVTYSMFREMRFEQDSTGATHPDDLASDTEWVERSTSEVLRHAARYSVRKGIDMENDNDDESEAIGEMYGGSLKKVKTALESHILVPEIRELESLAIALRNVPQPEYFELPISGYIKENEALSDEAMRDVLREVHDKDFYADNVELAVRDTVEEMQARYQELREDDTLSYLEFNTAMVYMQCGRCEFLELVYGDIPIQEIGPDHPMYQVPAEHRPLFARNQQMYGKKFDADAMLKYLANKEEFEELKKQHGPKLAIMKWQLLQAERAPKTRNQKRDGKDRSANKRLTPKERAKLKKQREKELRRKRREKKKGDEETE